MGINYCNAARLELYSYRMFYSTWELYIIHYTFPGGIKNPPDNAEDVQDVSLIPGSGRSPGGGHGNSLQYSCLENSKDRGVSRLWSTESQRAEKD